MKLAQQSIRGVSTPVQPEMVTVLTVTNALVLVNIYQCNSAVILTLFSKMPLDSMYQTLLQYSLMGIVLQIVFIYMNILNKKESDLLLSCFSHYHLVCYISQLTFIQWNLGCFWFIDFPKELGGGHGAGGGGREGECLLKKGDYTKQSPVVPLLHHRHLLATVLSMSCMIFLFFHFSTARLHREHLEMQSEFLKKCVQMRNYQRSEEYISGDPI